MFATIFLWSLTGCKSLIGTEVARLPINQVSLSEESLILKEASLDLKKDEEIVFWSEMDFEYEGNVQLLFKVAIFKDGMDYGGLDIDPTKMNVTLKELKKSIMGKTEWSYTGKNTKITIKEDGNYTFKGILIASENPSLVINKAELVLKL